MKLRLYHGRTEPDENLDDWGFDGPILEGVTGMHGTYFSSFNVFFTDRAACLKAKELTGWFELDDTILELKYLTDLVMTNVNGKLSYYGDWCLYE